MVGNYICEVLNGFQKEGNETKSTNEVQKKVINLCKKFPIYGENI